MASLDDLLRAPPWGLRPSDWSAPYTRLPGIGARRHRPQPTTVSKHYTALPGRPALGPFLVQGPGDLPIPQHAPHGRACRTGSVL
jgi:hypothetical protein